jgi:hypothetical protein
LANRYCTTGTDSDLPDHATLLANRGWPSLPAKNVDLGLLVISLIYCLMFFIEARITAADLYQGEMAVTTKALIK